MDYHFKKIWPDFWEYADQIIKIEELSFPTPWSAKAFEAETKKKISNFWALIREDNILGYICFWMFDSEIHIINFAVHPGERRKGLGQILLKQVVDAGITRGIGNLWLEVRPSNLAALSIYKKYGFAEVGRRVGYYNETSEDAIIMSLDLTREISFNNASNC